MNDIKLTLIEVIRRDGIPFKDPLNLLYLASYVSRNGVLQKNNIQLLCSDLDDVFASIKLHKPDVIGFSAVTPNFDYAKMLAKKIRKITNAPILLGGHHITGMPDALCSPFDIGIIGEGEETLSELITLVKKQKLILKELKNVKGIVFFDGHTLVVTPKRPLLDIHKIPQVDYSLVEKRRIFEYMTVLKGHEPITVRLASMYAARGCPYFCKFCAYQLIWGYRSGVRFFDVKKVVDQIEVLYITYGVTCINFLDDTFAVTKKRIKDLRDELKKRHLLGKVYFDNVFGRANLFDEEFASLLKEIGVTSIFFGIDSGSKRILDYLKNGSLTTKQVKHAIRICQKYDIWVIGSFMLFSPHETPQDMMKTYKLAQWFSRQKNAQRLAFGTTTPYPGTPMWEDAQKKHILDIKNRPWKEFVMNHGEFLPSFFVTSVSITDQKKIWSGFKELASYVKNRQREIPNWVAVNKITQRENRALFRSFRVQANFRRRTFRFLTEPDSMLKKLITDSNKISKIKKELLYIVFQKCHIK